MKRTLKIVGLTLGAVVALFAVASVLAFWFLDLDKVLNEQIAQRKPQLEEQLGRKVEVGKVSTSFLPFLGGTVAQISIAPDATHPEDDRPLVKVENVGFRVALWDALVSGGKKITVSDVHVDGVKLNLVRYKDGRLSYQDILDRQEAKNPPAASNEPSAPKKDEPLSPEVQDLLKRVSVSELRLGDAEIRLVDHATPSGQVAESFVKHLNVKLNDVRITDPIRIHVDAAVFADAQNFSLDTSVGPLPADLKLEGQPPVNGIKLHAKDIELARIVPYLGKSAPAKLDSASFSADWNVGAIAEGKPISTDGELAVKNVKFQGGAAFDVDAKAKLDADPKAMSVNVDRFDLKIGAVEIDMKGGLSDLATSPKFKDFTVHSTTLSPSLLLSYYPAAKKSVPEGTKLDGAASLDVKATGDAAHQTLVASMDMTGMDILYPGTLVKPKGTPLSVKVNGDFAASDASLKSFAFVLDELQLEGKGTVKNFAKPQLDLSVSAKPFSFDRLARLLPQAAESLAKSNAKAEGQGRFEASVKGSMTDLDAKLNLALTGVKLDVPDTHLQGDVTLKAAAKGNPSGDMKADVSFDADKAVIRVKDTMDKSAATPMHFVTSVERAGEKLIVKTFDFTLAELSMQAAGTLDQKSGTTDMKVDMKKLDLEKFAKTVTAVPADLAKKGFVDMKLALSGNPNQLETLNVSIDPMNLKVGKSDLSGKVLVKNLAAPDAEVRLASNSFDVDELFPEAEKKDAKVETTQQPDGKQQVKVDDPSLKKYRFNGLFDMRQVHVRGTDLKNFRGSMKLADGVLTLEDCSFETYGGSFSAKGTTAEIWKAKMPFHANLKVEGVDVNAVLSDKTKYANTLFGKGNFAVDLSGEGFELPDLEKSLNGNMEASMKEGRYSKASLTESVTGKLAFLDKIPGVKPAAIKGENAIKDLVAQLEVKEGKMHLKKALTTQVDGSPLTLDGAIGLAGGLFMTGTYQLPGAVVEKVTGGKCKVSDTFPVPVKVGGTVSSPAFSPDTAGIGKNLVEACLKSGLGGQAMKAVDDAKKKAEDAAREQMEKAKAEAEKQKAEAEAKAKAQLEQAKAEAEKQKAEAEAKAKAAADKLKAEAEAKKKAAEDEAKKKLKDKAGNALKGLGF